MSNKLIKYNKFITSPEVRVIDEKGKDLGIFLLENALKLAENMERDLIEVAGQICPAVCKLGFYDKYKYLQQKKEKRQKGKETVLKEIKFSVNTGEGDIITKCNLARKFINENNKVQFIIKLKGREQTKPEIVNPLIENIKQKLSDISVVEKPPKVEKKFISFSIAIKK